MKNKEREHIPKNKNIIINKFADAMTQHQTKNREQIINHTINNREHWTKHQK